MALLALVALAAERVHSAEAKTVDAQVDRTADDLLGEDDIEVQFPSGAGLKTDPELEALLKRAELFVGDGRFDLATILWQRVLDESGGTVMTRPEWIYQSFDNHYRKYASLAEEIERTIASLPPDGLRQYRLSADGEAQAVLAAGAGPAREEALAEVTRKYFISSLGDDAAFQLACLRLDRHDFIGAGRLLSRILNDYPDPSVARGEVLLRLALANARVGDVEAARSALARLPQTFGGSTLGRLAELVRLEIGSGSSTPAFAAADTWPMPLGGPTRGGHMQALADEVTKDTLSESWFEQFDISGPLASVPSGAQARTVFFGGHMAFSGRAVQRQSTSAPVNRQQLLDRWKSNGWLPTGQMLFHDGTVIYKRHDCVVARNAKTGELKWRTRPSAYAGSPLTQWLSNMRRAYRQQQSDGTRPSSPVETMLFADHLHQAMTIGDELFYTVDGPLAEEPAPPPSTLNRGYNWQNVPHRTRANFLSAYEMKTGKFRWRRAADGGIEGSKFDVGFMAAPVPYGRMLLVPVSDNGSLWIHALDKTSGDLPWKTFLCEDPISGASPYSPVGLAVDGGDAYVATGGGVVFALDAMSGAVRWAFRYQRSTTGGINMARFGIAQSQLKDVIGWESDVVIPHGRALVVMASDSDKLFAIDRRSGQFLWESPRKPAAQDDPSLYCLGMLSDGLFVAGKRSLRRYDLSKEGRLMWEATFAQSYGHGVLTADAVYMPVGDSVAKFDPATGEKTAQVPIFTPTEEPAGNLFSDGRQLLSVGLARTYALQDLETRLASLAERIAAGNGEAQLQRMRLRLRGEQFDLALADLKDACQLIRKQQGAAAANATMYEGIGELDLAARDPRLALELVIEAEEHLRAAKEQYSSNADGLKQLIAQRDGVIRAALRQISQDEVAGAAGEILAVAAMVERTNLLAAAREAIAASAGEADAPLLKEALEDENANKRIVATSALAGALGEAASPLLADLLSDDNDEVRLAAARALANEGDRRSLKTLGELLNSDDLHVRSRSVQALRALTGQRFKFVAYEKPETRSGPADEWRKWIGAEGQTAKLTFPIGDSRVLLGRTLLALYSQSRVVEYDTNLKQTWELKGIQRPWAAEGLPNGHRLIASYNGKFVAEYDENGKQVWRKDGLPGYASNAHRLDNGNTLVSCANAQKVLEISPEKEIVWEARINGNPQDARRLENGNTLVALQSASKVVEIDRKGDIKWEINKLRGPFSASRLDNGNTLVALQSAGEVAEYDRSGKQVWKHSGLSSPYDAQRLDNGNTLIVDRRGYREVDSRGKVLLQKNISGALRIHRY